MNSNVKVIKTSDGSHTIYLPDMDEHYHSTHGARQESEHVYILMGLDAFVKENPEAKEINILEVGFGTGLNAFLTYLYATEHNLYINYITLEPYPINEDNIKSLNFNFIENEKSLFDEIHKAKWNSEVILSSHFKIKKMDITLEKFDDVNIYDVIYFDAFAPNKQKNIWDSGNFLKLFNVLRCETGILTTYCAQGEFKRTVKKVGFQVVEKEGPPGKRVMTCLKKQ